MKLLSLSDCIALCLLTDDDKCHAVVHAKASGTCSFANIVKASPTTTGIIAKDQGGDNDVTIYAQATKVKPRAGYVPVLVSFYNHEVTHQRLNSSPEVEGELPVVGPAIEDWEHESLPSLLVQHGNGFIACGGQTTQPLIVKTCR